MQHNTIKHNPPPQLKMPAMKSKITAKQITAHMDIDFGIIKTEDDGRNLISCLQLILAHSGTTSISTRG
jgi:hypothetical protein